ncbi:type II toxin-antitoxin system RelB/DinJ family antitoxin [Candidatus Saccharibacteria bacterium]|nr:type II toxin-antitoxin system RelB/DinJ family antitoxin [Candidatus Saccharibacteria bacterium]
MSTTTITTNRPNNLIQVRVPADLKERTARLFESLGTNTSDVIRMMLLRADETKSIPFQVRSGAYPLSANERIREVVATFALENMPLSEQDMQELRDIELGKTTTEEVRQRVLKEIKEENKKCKK